MLNGAGSSPPRLNKNYVLAPFHQLLSNCQTNVLLGLRLIEKIDRFPPPTPEETAILPVVIPGGRCGPP
jgi:hypothetical protein